jgi:DNA repair exonuclease SbcCD ATPase subunit
MPSITAVTLRGFRSFASEQRWELQNSGAGLYYVTGRNEVEPDLEANGAGKSSLFEALYLGFYGKTSRGLRAGNVQCWLPDSPNCQISIEFDGHLLIRSWGPNSLSLWKAGGQPKPVDQIELEKFIGIQPDAFLQTFYFAQFGSSFVELGPTERLSLLSDILQLDRWEAASTTAGKYAAELKGKQTELNMKLATARGTHKQLIAYDYQKESDAWEQATTAKIENLRAQVPTAAIVTFMRKQNIAQQALDAHLANALSSSKVSDMQKLLEDQKVQRSTTLKLQYAMLPKIKLLEQQIANLAALDGSAACPNCMQPVSHEHAMAETNALEKQKTKLQGEYEVLRISMEQTTDLIQSYENHLATFEKEAKQHEIETKKLEAVVDKFLRMRENAEHAAASLRQRIDEQKDSVNPYIALRKKRAIDIENATLSINLLEAQLAEVEPNIKGMEFWVKGFKDLRLFIVQQVITQLEIEINNTLVQLGLAGWTMQCTVEQETKSGTLKRGFAILVKAPHSKSAVPFEVWSGGEAQRLRIAIYMGLSNLIANRLGISCNVEMWDEPSQHMSNAGISEMLQVLSDRASNLGRAVWLADHHVLDYGRFVGSLCVAKTAAGSVIDSSRMPQNGPKTPPWAEDMPKPAPVQRRRLVRA